MYVMHFFNTKIIYMILIKYFVKYLDLMSGIKFEGLSTARSSIMIQFIKPSSRDVLM